MTFQSSSQTTASLQRRAIEDWHDQTITPFAVTSDRRVRSEERLSDLALKARKALAHLLQMRNKDFDRYVTWNAAIIKANRAA